MLNLSKCFEKKTRENGDRFYTLRDDAPEWLRDAVQEAHHGTMPDDWVYDLCHTAACGWDDESLRSDDDIAEFADANVDVYTRERFKWAADMCLTSLYSEAEERAKDIGATNPDTAEQLGVLQYCAIELVASVMLRAFEENADAEETVNE